MSEFPVEVSQSLLELAKRFYNLGGGIPVYKLNFVELAIIQLIMCIPKMEEKDWSKITNDEIFQTICADLTRKGILSIDEKTQTLNIDL